MRLNLTIDSLLGIRLCDRCDRMSDPAVALQGAAAAMGKPWRDRRKIGGSKYRSR